MASYRIITSNEANQDLRDIYRYIARVLKEPSIADNLLDKIETGILSLAELPLRHNVVKDERLGQKGIRKLLIGNYLIFYVVDEDNQTVQIVRILYARRDWVNIL